MTWLGCALEKQGAPRRSRLIDEKLGGTRLPRVGSWENRHRQPQPYVAL